MDTWYLRGWVLEYPEFFAVSLFRNIQNVCFEIFCRIGSLEGFKSLS